MTTFFLGEGGGGVEDTFFLGGGWKILFGGYQKVLTHVKLTSMMLMWYVQN